MKGDHLEPLPVIHPPHPVVAVDRAVRDAFWTRRATWQSDEAQGYVKHAALAAERRRPHG